MESTAELEQFGAVESTVELEQSGAVESTVELEQSGAVAGLVGVAMQRLVPDDSPQLAGLDGEYEELVVVFY